MAKESNKSSPIVYVLVMLFGLGSWVSVNALWVELPMLVEVLPEGWGLPSYLTVIIQFANVGFIGVTIANYTCHKKINLIRIIYCLEFVGFAGTLLLAFIWDQTAEINGTSRSIGLFAMTFVVALVDCTTSVTFIPYMARYKSQYITAYFIGGGLSSLVPASLALGQGTAEAPQCNNSSNNGTHNKSDDSWSSDQTSQRHVAFTPQTFFICVSAFMALSAVAFALLNVLQVSQAEQNVKEGEEQPLSSGSEAHATEIQEESSFHLKSHVPLLLLVAISCCLSNSALTSVQTYSCLPYGRRAYHLTVVLSNIAQPLACFLPFYVSTKRLWAVTTQTVVAGGLAAYIFVTAATSPLPPLVHSPAGEPLLITVWVLCIGLLAYCKTVQAGILHGGGDRGLLACGVATQVGSAIGAFVMFPLVNVYNLFHAILDCV